MGDCSETQVSEKKKTEMGVICMGKAGSVTNWETHGRVEWEKQRWG